MNLMQLKQLFLPALAYKMLAGFLVGLAYSHFYSGGDTWAMFGDGLIWAHSHSLGELLEFLIGLEEVPQSTYQMQATSGNRVLFTNLFVGISLKLLGENYWLINAAFSLISFFGIWKFIQALVEDLGHTPWKATFAYCLWPSIAFWGSGLLKESLLLGSLGMIASTGIALRFRPNYWKRRWFPIEMLLCSCAMLFLWKVKFYYFAVFIIAFGGWLVADSWYMLNNRQLKTALLYAFPLLLALGLWVGSKSHPYYMSLNGLPLGLYNNHQHILEHSPNPSNIIHMPKLGSEWSEVIPYAPKALWEGSFRPYVWEAGHLLKKAHGLDGILLMLLILIAFLQGLPKKVARQSPRMKLLLLFGAVYFITLAVFLPIAAPNIGALVRYRVGYWPVAIGWLLEVVNWKVYIEKNPHSPSSP